MSERASLLVSSGDGPGECRQAVVHLLVWLTEESERRGLDIDIAEREASHGPSSAVVVLTAFFWFATGEDRIGANAVVEGIVMRTVAAPFDGVLNSGAMRVTEPFASASGAVSSRRMSTTWPPRCALLRTSLP